MTSRNLYLTYKKDTSRLLHWVINTSNGIIKSGVEAEHNAFANINTTGQCTVAEIVGMSKLIAKHLNPVPSSILVLFQAVIRARSATYAAFQQIVVETPDPEIESSNATHKHFIDALTEAFNALGGNRRESGDAIPPANDTEADSLFENQFSALSLGRAKDENEEISSADEASPAPVRQQKRRTGKGKKSKQRRNAKHKPASEAASGSSMANIPFEAYRIIEDQGGLVSEYLMAVHAVVREWMELRAFTQDLWREVAYDGLNSAIAASLTNTAVTMVKQTCIAVFAEFPGHESYNTIIQTITRGNPEKAQANFGLSLYRTSDNGEKPEKVQETNLDVKENFWIHTYNDFTDFIMDFQKNRSGKPTKAMQAQLNDWSPTFDLQRATNEDRVKWRRAYTINWLYDLVNIFSAIVVQRNTMKGEKHVYENVDWSPSGPWDHHRRLFGLQEFAGEVTTLAFQKPGTDVRNKILPHHVFHLQCIVESFTASRGWTLSPLRGHHIASPPRKYRPRRDVDLFLDRDIQRDGHGILQSIDFLKQLLQKDADLHQDPQRHTGISDLLGDFSFDFINWLGESMYKFGLTTIPASRFSKHNANGLWEYSPFLCGAGLIEGLVLMQRVAMLLWDQIPEPTLVLHLHNMLVKKGYLSREVGLFATIESMMQDSFFPEGVPDNNFSDALVALTKQGRGERNALRQRKALDRNMANNPHRVLDPQFNRFFKTKSALMMYYDAGWAPEQIPDSVVRIPSMLYMARLTSTAQVLDPATGQRKLEETEIVKRARALGQTDAALLEAASVPISDMLSSNDAAAATHLQNILPDLHGYKTPQARNPYRVADHKPHSHLQGRDLLALLRIDIFADVCGNHPLSALNHTWTTCLMLLLFLEIERHLHAARHPLYMDAYEHPKPQMRRHKRVALVVAAMSTGDEQALTIMAQCFETLRVGMLGCCFWEKMREGETGMRAAREWDDEEMPSDQCAVM
ncbi:hypothetical protein ACN47E_006558 [Coniothyrium glycines]